MVRRIAVRFLLHGHCSPCQGQCAQTRTGSRPARISHMNTADSQLLGDATEQLSMKLGQTLGGLLNATFGNAVELIVAIAALVQSTSCPAIWSSFAVSRDPLANVALVRIISKHRLGSLRALGLDGTRRVKADVQTNSAWSRCRSSALFCLIFCSCWA